MWTKIDYKDICFLRCNINYAGKATVKNEYCRNSAFKGKDCYFSDTGASIYEGLDIAANVPKPGLGQKLFISKSSRMPRALLRGSDYKIKMDKADADFIVVPYPDNIFKRTWGMVMKCGDILYGIRITKDYGAPEINSDVVANVQQAISNYIGGDAKLFFNKTDLSEREYWFVKKCEEYDDMLNCSYSQASNFVFDRKVKFIPTTEVTPDNLELLIRCNDMNMFERMIFGSDWQTYPFTICTLLYMHPRYYNDSGLKYVEEAIHYNEYDDGVYSSGREVTPEDWNMTQRWMMVHNGLDEEKGGWMNIERWSNLKYKEAEMLHHAVMIKPLYITETTSTKTLKEML